MSDATASEPWYRAALKMRSNDPGVTARAVAEKLGVSKNKVEKLFKEMRKAEEMIVRKAFVDEIKKGIGGSAAAPSEADIPGALVNEIKKRIERSAAAPSDAGRREGGSDGGHSD